MGSKVACRSTRFLSSSWPPRPLRDRVCPARAGTSPAHVRDNVSKSNIVVGVRLAPDSFNKAVPSLVARALGDRARGCFVGDRPAHPSLRLSSMPAAPRARLQSCTGRFRDPPAAKGVASNVTPHALWACACLAACGEGPATIPAFFEERGSEADTCSHYWIHASTETCSYKNKGLLVKVCWSGGSHRFSFRFSVTIPRSCAALHFVRSLIVRLSETLHAVPSSFACPATGRGKKKLNASPDLIFALL